MNDRAKKECRDVKFDAIRAKIVSETSVCFAIVRRSVLSYFNVIVIQVTHFLIPTKLLISYSFCTNSQNTKETNFISNYPPEVQPIPCALQKQNLITCHPRRCGANIGKAALHFRGSTWSNLLG